MAEDKKTVLIVDDEIAHRMLIKRAVSSAFADAKLVEAESLSDGKEIVSNNTEIDLVILDLNLNGEWGLNLLELIRDSLGNDSLPVIVHSTSNLMKDMERSYSKGANCFITKHPDPDEYRQNLHGALRFFLR